jgi:hypothetical protein
MATAIGIGKLHFLLEQGNLLWAETWLEGRVMKIGERV